MWNSGGGCVTFLDLWLWQAASLSEIRDAERVSRGDKKEVGVKAKAKRVHHIGVTVHDAEKVVDLWSKLLDCEARVVHLKEKQLKIGVVRVAGVTFFFNEVTEPSKKAQIKQSVTCPKPCP